MKKFFLTIILLGLMTTVSAQFAVSAHLGGSYYKGNTQYSGVFNGYSHTTLADTTYALEFDPKNADIPLNLTGGLKVGYQFGRLQFGLSGSFSFSQVKGDLSAEQYNRFNPNLNPDNFINTNWQMDDYQGYYTIRQTGYTIAPYLRYEVIQLGDVAFFMELDAFYTKANQSRIFQFVDFYHAEMHHTFEIDSVAPVENTSMGLQLIPGLSWQLAEHCNIELYFDVLSLAYRHNIHKEVGVVSEWNTTAYPYVLSQQVTTTTVTTTNTIGFETNGVPVLGGQTRNWVRVGFNYTF